ncbi:hypothetical protein Tco_0770250 [Tanacetum coccineum]|uniref:Uncharacterized protein n=1 Tax=Tanacetum coccineum TaxID=301880 RepID=A0ABQ4ZBP0_9ASTR
MPLSSWAKAKTPHHHVWPRWPPVGIRQTSLNKCGRHVDILKRNGSVRPHSSRDCGICYSFAGYSSSLFSLKEVVNEQKLEAHAATITLIFRKGKGEHDMSNSDELRHTDNTTLIPPRLPDTLPQVYHRRRPTLGLLILPSVLPFPPTIRRTARMSVLPIEPNLAERARISAINLDDYQLDPVTPPPSPSSPFSMAAYQRMIAETDPTHTNIDNDLLNHTKELKRQYAMRFIL